MNISIRPLSLEDSYTSFAWRNDPEIWKHTGSRPNKYISESDELEWIKHAIGEKDSKRFGILADGTYIGNTYFTGIEKGKAEYHIFIGDKSFWGKGVAQDTLRLMIEYAKNVIKLSKITLSVNEMNSAAIHIYKKYGFIATGRAGKSIKMELTL